MSPRRRERERNATEDPCKRVGSDGDLHTVAFKPAVSTMVGAMLNVSRNCCETMILICVWVKGFEKKSEDVALGWK